MCALLCGKYYISSDKRWGSRTGGYVEILFVSWNVVLFIIFLPSNSCPRWCSEISTDKRRMFICLGAVFACSRIEGMDMESSHKSISVDKAKILQPENKIGYSGWMGDLIAAWPDLFSNNEPLQCHMMQERLWMLRVLVITVAKIEDNSSGIFVLQNTLYHSSVYSYIFQEEIFFLLHTAIQTLILCQWFTPTIWYSWCFPIDLHQLSCFQIYPLPCCVGNGEGPMEVYEKYPENDWVIKWGVFGDSGPVGAGYWRMKAISLKPTE